ncbi:hypothetical protein DPMN_179317 [Dreissena polymorpha]|uniref:RNase H type-1 domain-containing protein n=1 Tax=Dreissena polymorpha TaxID=45954 RepID=A0A9D4EEW8_DREPO|nr:hypothetical protein DPMN_179317 [Dreissena polymorpha]
MDIMMEAPQDCTFAFTDGSCLTNPGPTGAGAVLYPPGGDTIRLKRAVTKHGTILLAELVAVLMVLEEILQHPHPTPGYAIQIFSDSQTVVGILTMGWKNNGHKSVIEEIKKAFRTLSVTTSVHVLWTPGHAGLQGRRGIQSLMLATTEDLISPLEFIDIVSISEGLLTSNQYFNK